jgi:hypothetical protein
VRKAEGLLGNPSALGYLAAHFIQGILNLGEGHAVSAVFTVAASGSNN